MVVGLAWGGMHVVSRSCCKRVFLRHEAVVTWSMDSRVNSELPTHRGQLEAIQCNFGTQDIRGRSHVQSNVASLRGRKPPISPTRAHFLYCLRWTSTDAAPGRDTARLLVNDMRIAIRGPSGGQEMKRLRKSHFQEFSNRALQALTACEFSDSVEVFYWLLKCAQTANEELDEGILELYIPYVRSQARQGSESHIIRLLQTTNGLVNRNKLARSIDTDVNLQLDRVIHELLSTSLERFCSRHQHLPLQPLTALLSSYAKNVKPEYVTLFTALAPDAIKRAMAARSQFHAKRQEFFVNGPFVLVAYAQAGCPNQDVFDAYLDVFESSIQDLTYELAAVLAYSVARAGIDRPSLWKLLQSELSDSSQWTVRQLGLLIGCCRDILRRESADRLQYEAVLSLLSKLSECLLPRKAEYTFHEAADAIAALAFSPVSAISNDSIAALLEMSCGIAKNSPGDFPASYLATSFHGLLALHCGFQRGWLAASDPGVRANISRDVSSALGSMATRLRSQLCLCQPSEMCLVVETLRVIVRVDTDCNVSTLETLLLVSQREGVRKAAEFDPSAFRYFVDNLTDAAKSWEERGDSSVSILRPWFLSESSKFTSNPSSQKIPENIFAADSAARRTYQDLARTGET